MTVDPKPRAGDPLALYGSLMRGLGAMQALEIGDGLAYQGPAIIAGVLYDLGAYPGLCPGDGRVVGELYSIEDVECLARLDEFEGVDPSRPSQSLYRREWLPLIEPGGSSAWVYLYNRKPDPEARIGSGDWRAHRESAVEGSDPSRGKTD